MSPPSAHYTRLRTVRNHERCFGYLLPTSTLQETRSDAQGDPRRLWGSILQALLPCSSGSPSRSPERLEKTPELLHVRASQHAVIELRSHYLQVAFALLPYAANLMSGVIKTNPERTLRYAACTCMPLSPSHIMCSSVISLPNPLPHHNSSKVLL